jgi:pyridoxal 5'-phosphate synthase pdxT subunit
VTAGEATAAERAGGPAIGVLAFQGDVAEHLRALRESGARASLVRRPAELDAVDALVIPGGESTTMWKLAEIFELAEPLRKRIADGMIMLATRLTDPASGQETLGAIDMAVRRNAFGRQVDSFERELEIGAIGDTSFRAVFIRAPWVEETGAGVEVLATEPATGRIVAVRQGPVLATAFHPELTGDRRIHKLFADMVRERS